LTCGSIRTGVAGVERVNGTENGVWLVYEIFDMVEVASVLSSAPDFSSLVHLLLLFYMLQTLIVWSGQHS
jgi:hypothetical protein